MKRPTPIPPHLNPPTEAAIDGYKLAIWFGVSQRTLHNWCRKGLIPWPAHRRGWSKDQWDWIKSDHFCLQLRKPQ